MRWLFHRERIKRYQIVIQELRVSFQEKKGLDLLVHLSQLPKALLNLDEDRLIYQFEKLVECLNEEKEHYRRQHRRFVKRLRKMIRQVDTLSFKENWHYQLQNLLLEFCLTRYHRTHFFSFGRALLEKLFSALTFSKENTDFQEHFANYNFLEEAHLIEKSGPLLFFERDFKKFDEFFLKRQFDSHQYNLPFLLYTLPLFRQGEVVKIKMVRMGSPTKESWIQKPTVIQEFKGFLKKLAEKGESHLYINKQKTWGEEGRRSQKIIELEKEFENFFCVCLPSDGDFYEQKKRFEKISCAKEFTQLFYKMLLEQVNSKYYHLPLSWKEDPLFCKGLQKTIERVHRVYFEQKPELSFQERRLFIDLAYTELIVFFLQYAPIQSVNITCRDGIDRAGCEQSKLLYYFQIALGIEKEIESFKELQFILHFPVYLAKTRPIVLERREFLYQVFRAYTPKIKACIRLKQKQEPILFARPHFIKRTFKEESFKNSI